MADLSNGSSVNSDMRLADIAVSPNSLSRRRRAQGSRKSLARALSSGLELSDDGGDIPEYPGAAKMALIDAAGAGLLKRAEKLLAAGVPANSVDIDGNSPLICAAEEGHEDVVHLLLQHKADVLVRNVETESALHVAAWNGHIAVVEALLAAGAGASVNQPGPSDETPLLLAADGGYAQVAKMLLEAGADPSCQNERGETPLQWAAWSGSKELVELFLSHGADLHAVDHHPSAGFTALLCAAHQGHAEVLQLLIDRGARLDVLDSSQRSALALAAGGGYLDCVRVLLAAGASKCLIDEPATSACIETRGRTPLLLAAGRGHLEVVEELLKAGPALNAIDADGCTALHLAAQDGHLEIVRLLLEHGLVDGLPDLKGRTPADLARLNGHAAVAKVLNEGATKKENALPDSFWVLVELALQNTPRSQLESVVTRARQEAKAGTYLGCTLRFFLQKHGWSAEQ